MAFISFKEFIDLFESLLKCLFIISFEVMLVFHQLLNEVVLGVNGDLSTSMSIKDTEDVIVMAIKVQGLDGSVFHVKSPT